MADDPTHEATAVDTRSDAMRRADRANGEADPDLDAGSDREHEPADRGDEAGMRRCVVCGNTYDRSFEVRVADGGETYVFDCFECAIHRLAPVCGQCECRVIGHGVEVEGRIYCGAHCARHQERTDAPSDRVGDPS